MGHSMDLVTLIRSGVFRRSVLVQDRLLFIREDFSTEPPVEERSKFTDNIPPVQLRAIDRLFLQLEEVEKTASWQALRQISLDVSVCR